ncbi:hypothetical protein PG991_006663 [Apiospora marii]|uniref:HNH endonuclease n=1 Tax=Apiospora marii TaxID=335849 RepID=A0ABR1RZS2_9PEZI
MENNRDKDAPGAPSPTARGIDVIRALRPTNQDLQRNRQDLAADIESVEAQRARDAAANRCGWCHDYDHTVKDCAGPPGADGTIAACVLHNAKHLLSECPEAREWNLAEKYRWLVASRGNLPPLQYHERWEDVAWAWIDAQGGRCDDALPFTAEFCKRVPRIKYANYDRDDPTREPLGYEERTSSVAAFRQWYARENGLNMGPSQ